jgi:cell division protein FtsB
MAERKVAGRKLAIVLGVVSVILAVGLVIALVAYLPASAQVSTLNAQIAEKDQTIAALNLQITSLQNNGTSQSANAAQVTTLQTEIASLQAEIADLSNVLYLNATGVLVNSQAFTQEPYTNVTIWDGSQPLQYAGYVTVQLQSSSNLTYAEVLYNSFGVAYDNVVTLGNGTASFPVLPSNAVIVLGNNDNVTATGTVTALYHY